MRFDAVYTNSNLFGQNYNKNVPRLDNLLDLEAKSNENDAVRELIFHNKKDVHARDRVQFTGANDAVDYVMETSAETGQPVEVEYSVRMYDDFVFE